MHRPVSRSRKLVAPAVPLTYRAVEFFAGIGLVRLALERQRWRVIFANDIEPQKLRMYEANFGRDDFNLGDIHNLPAADIPEAELFTASFPCNDLSIAGSMDGLDGKESSAFWGLIRILTEMGDRRPPLVLLENVVGFLMSDDGKDFEKALVALNALGYAVDAITINASHWVPQSRPRLFVVAKHERLSGGHGGGWQPGPRSNALTAFITTHPHIRWDLRPLPSLPERQISLEKVIEDLPDDAEEWWNRERAKYFMDQLSERHLVDAKAMIAAKQVSYATAFRRVRNGRSMAELRTDGIAGCLRTPRGGSGRQILFKAGMGRSQVRLFTGRECARLQGVPDSYAIDVPLNQALFGFGDAVCVPAIEWISEHYLRPEITAMIGMATTKRKGRKR